MIQGSKPKKIKNIEAQRKVECSYKKRYVYNKNIAYHMVVSSIVSSDTYKAHWAKLGLDLW